MTVFRNRGPQNDSPEKEGVTAKRLNEQVRRNAERFPKDFMFCLSGL